MRMKRIQRLHGMLKGVGDVDLPRFLATCEYQMGITKERARIYLETLETLGYIKVDDVLGKVSEIVQDG